LWRGERPIIRSNGLFTRDYIYVEDVVDGYLALCRRAAEEGISGEAFNFSPESRVTVIEIARLIQRLFGREDLEPRILDQARAEIKDQYLAHAPAAVRKYWERERPIEIRPVSLTHYFSDEKLDPVQHVWVRATGPVPDDRYYQAAILAYLSDMTLLDTSLYPHGTSIFDQTIQVASLDHSMWFHRPTKLDDWLLYTQDSPSASGARGLTRGSLFTRDGTLIASVAQEGLIRKRANE